MRRIFAEKYTGNGVHRQALNPAGHCMKHHHSKHKTLTQCFFEVGPTSKQ